MVQDQLEPSPGVGTLVEGDIDDLSQPLCVLVRLVLVERGLDGLWLGDDPEVGPRGGDLSGGQELRADQPDRLDVPVLELRSNRFGEIREAADLDERQIQVITSLEQECVQQRAVVSGLIQVLDELLERPWRAGVAERPLESVEGGILALETGSETRYGNWPAGASFIV